MAHLTTEQRYAISCMLQQGKSQSEIAASIAKDKSVISREIVRNKDQRSGVYRHDLAHRKYAQRQKKKPKNKRFTLRIQSHVETLLKEDYSPEQICRHQYKRRDRLCLSRAHLSACMERQKTPGRVTYSSPQKGQKVSQKRGY